MDQMNVKVLFLIAAATTAIVGALKKAFPGWVSGKEELLAIALPILFVVVCKTSGLYKGTDWVDSLIWAVGGGVGSGLAHDYVVNPVIASKNDAGAAK